MNFERGLKRAWLVILAVLCTCIMAAAITQADSSNLLGTLGAWLGGMLIFSVLWLGIGYCLLWVIRGFIGTSKSSDSR